ncbi:MAG: hypothetical protein ACOVQA_02320 [Thermoflexibacteraceae bacterium]
MKHLFSPTILRKILLIISIHQASFTCICQEPIVVQFKFIAKPTITAYEVVGIKANKSFDTIKFDIDTMNNFITYPSIPLDLNADTTAMLIKTYQGNQWQQDTLVLLYTRKFYSTLSCGGGVSISNLTIKKSSFLQSTLLANQYGNFIIQLQK